ncbi:hypothetical protein D3C72_1729560 [compost metagenome]
MATDAQVHGAGDRVQRHLLHRPGLHPRLPGKRTRLQQQLQPVPRSCRHLVYACADPGVRSLVRSIWTQPHDYLRLCVADRDGVPLLHAATYRTGRFPVCSPADANPVATVF